MTEKNTNKNFVKYRLTWRFTDDGTFQESAFYLPWGIEPSEYVGSILSVVELSASEYGYSYELDIIECPNFHKDEDYYDRVVKGEVDDWEYVARINNGKQSCQDCIWVQDKTTCLYDEIHEPVIVTGLVSRVLDAVDKANEKIAKLEEDKAWLEHGISKGPEHLGDI